MNRNTRLIGMGLLVATCAIALAAQDAISIKFAPKVGDTMKYKMSANMQVGSMGAATVGADIQDKVTKADGDGYTVETSQSNENITFNGQSMPGQDSSNTTVFKSNGEIVDLQGDQMSPDSWRLAELNNFVYPDKPVKIGDEWTSTVAKDEKKGTVAATCSYKVDSMEKVGSHDTVKIKVTYKETDGTDPASSDGFAWVDTKDGSMVKATATWANVPVSGQMASGTVTMERTD